MNQKTALILHHDDSFCQRMTGILSGMDCGAEISSSESIPLKKDGGFEYQMVIAHEDLVMDKTHEDWSALITRLGRTPLILISDRIDVRNAVRAIKSGVHDYFSKDSDSQSIETSLNRAFKLNAEKTNRINRSTKQKSHRAIITGSPRMKQLLKTAERVADSSATILIEGESGTGKELLARHLHQQGNRKEKPFVAMNCAALPENLAESELFGYDKGAFTGATKNRMGKFEQAQGGSLVLDEISEMPLSLQVKLLRVLQEKEVDHIGGQKPIPIDVRVIATSNRDLVEMVKSGKFRQDLYYRLRVIPLKIPPLRERKEDIPLLVDYFAEKFKALHHRPDVEISRQALDQLSQWSWPGNVRELENTMERALLICEGNLVEIEHLLIDESIADLHDDGRHDIVGMTVKEIEKKLIGQTLKHVNENRTHAAKMLGISIRTLRNKLREYADTEIQYSHSGQGH